jgi:hypothetical protein
MRRLPWILALSMLAGWELSMTGCVAPPPPSQRVSDAARDLNSAARFGRMDLALEHTADGARRHFQKHRERWGNEVRVLDFELASLSMKDNENATVFVDIQWMRVDEDTLHVTRVEQTWQGTTETKGWALVRERRASGDLGLFGERVARAEKPEHGDVQFASKTLKNVEQAE